MPEMIRKGAAAEDILSVARETIENANSRGGDWKTLADERLADTLALATAVEARITEAKRAAAPFLSALATQNELTDKAIGKIGDDIWNDLDRPAAGNDPYLSVLFPGGIAYYTDGDVEEQPTRMTLLAELLEGGVHPRLPRDKSRAYAEQVRSLATELDSKVEAARAPRLRVTLLERTYTAAAKTAQIQLANLKRGYKSKGHSEAEIHRVIPSAPARRAKPAAGDGGGGSGGTT